MEFYKIFADQKVQSSGFRVPFPAKAARLYNSFGQADEQAEFRV